MKNHQKTAGNPPSTLLWFRRDLRVSNNPALRYAAERGGEIVAIYIEPQPENRPWQPGAAARWWCHESLASLSKQLAKLGIRLRYFCGDASHIIPMLVNKSGASAVCWNRLYEPDEVRLEKDLLQNLQGVEVQRFDSHLMFTPGTIQNQQDQAYRVFTPFWKNARRRLEVQGVTLCKPFDYRTSSDVSHRFQSECLLEDLGLLDDPPWHRKLNTYWTPGETTAHHRLAQFINNSIENYDQQRELPASQGTSKLSPHLHFGEITPAQIVYKLLEQDLLSQGSASVERFLTELGWREFAHHILWHFPASPDHAMYDKYRDFWPKKANQKLLKAWQTGNTGIPLVDAGMRELWETGWLHNRVRMIVGSFLTKNLGIHWLHGARWFWDTLVDADLANNTMGWQWVAGCGVDAAPYYRIFNPVTQAQRFDREQIYINRWVKEINQDNYIQPVIDLASSRQTALKRYSRLKEKNV